MTMTERSGSDSTAPEVTVYIGTKPVMTYVFEVISQLGSGVSEVKIKARGNSISHAVDVAEVARRHKLMDGKVGIRSIRIGTERLVNRAGRETNVSTIEINLSKPALSGQDSEEAAPQVPASVPESQP